MPAAPTFKAETAEISGHLFENPRMGVPRGICWSCNVDFAPISDQIHGLTLESCVGPLTVEASPALWRISKASTEARFAGRCQKSTLEAAFLVSACFRTTSFPNQSPKHRLSRPWGSSPT